MDGKKLIEWGFVPGAWFKEAIAVSDAMEKTGCDISDILDRVRDLQPAEKIGLRETGLEYAVFANPENSDEVENIESAKAHMDSIMKIPTVKAGAMMPDVCPSGSQMGTIPVGCIVACEDAIHPSFHSADICCSVAISVLPKNVDASKVLDAAMQITHFGPGGRIDNVADKNKELKSLIDTFEENQFLSGLERRATNHYMTQGDGNHFFFVGEMDDRTVIVTHHGSRGFGASLYRRGKDIAERETRKIARVPLHQSWIKADSKNGQDYWAALQIVRKWTKLNHFGIHDAVLQDLGFNHAEDRFWNEHNFVFQKSDGLFYHAKGATPNYPGFADDASGLTLIPLNMRDGILVSDYDQFKGRSDSLGFCPHGAGRNMSRTSHEKMLKTQYDASGDLSSEVIETIIRMEVPSIDARFWSSLPDVTELPSAYKSAQMIEKEMKDSNLAKISKKINALGSIMAGNLPRNW